MIVSESRNLPSNLALKQDAEPRAQGALSDLSHSAPRLGVRLRTPAQLLLPFPCPGCLGALLSTGGSLALSIPTLLVNETLGFGSPLQKNLH